MNRDSVFPKGRPKAGSSQDIPLDIDNTKHQCDVCARLFPSQKSINVHVRIHTKEKPFMCDFPGCAKVFTQSGHLRTHQRIHSGEKPFMCPIAGCPVRHTHSNRRCSNHPDMKFIRDEEMSMHDGNMENKDEQELQWLQQYWAKEANRKTPKSKKRKATESSKDRMPDKKPRQNLSDNSVAVADDILSGRQELEKEWVKFLLQFQ